MLKYSQTPQAKSALKDEDLKKEEKVEDRETEDSDD